MPRLPDDDRKTFNVYDAMFCAPFEQLSDLPSGFRLFGVSNIGNPSFTSMQVAGLIAPAKQLQIGRWYLRTTLIQQARHDNYDEQEAARAFGNFADMTIAMLEIDGRVVKTTPLSELGQYEASLGRGVIVPPRTNVSVHVNMFGPAKEALLLAARLSFNVDDIRRPGWPALWIHLAGCEAEPQPDQA